MANLYGSPENKSCLHDGFAYSHTRGEVKVMSSRQNKKHDAKKSSESVTQSYLSNLSFRNDPSGSYTGHSKDGKKPEQDADDL